MNRRLILGFSVAPLAPCLLAATIESVYQGKIVLIPIATVLYAIFAYPFVFVLGIPAYILMSRFGLVSMPYVTSAGLFLGCVSGILMPLTLGAEWQRVFDGHGRCHLGWFIHGDRCASSCRELWRFAWPISAPG